MYIYILGLCIFMSYVCVDGAIHPEAPPFGLTKLIIILFTHPTANLFLYQLLGIKLNTLHNTNPTT